MKISKTDKNGRTSHSELAAVHTYAAVYTAQQYNHQICNLNKGDK